jgi:hypothetical protein
MADFAVSNLKRLREWGKAVQQLLHNRGAIEALVFTNLYG